jgi:acetyl-CoA decarbonylase/synthase complex subunit epsilon
MSPSEGKDKLDTTRRAHPYDRADFVGTKSARAVKPEVIAKTIKKMKRALLVIGSNLSDEELAKVVEFAKVSGLEVVGAGGVAGRLKDIPNHYMNLHLLVGYIIEGWKGFDGNGKYDALVFVGHIYYHLSPMLRALSNFSSTRLISIDRYYYPSADMTFGNLSDKEFIQALDKLVSVMREE